jgi:hypothetical protein
VSRQKVGLQWRKCIVAVQICIPGVDHAGVTVLVMPIVVFEEAIIETSKIHSLFIHYSNDIYFSVLKSS